MNKKESKTNYFLEWASNNFQTCNNRKSSIKKKLNEKNKI